MWVPSWRSGFDMTTLMNGRFAVLAFAVVLAGAGSSQARQDARQDCVVVIVNKQNELSDLSLKDLRTLFRLDRRTWPSGTGPVSGTDVSLLLRSSDSVEQKVVLDRIYGMTADQLERHWVEIIYQGKVSSAPTVKSG